MLRNKRNVNRWLKAIEIAKVVFWHEGYHIRYLEEIEEFIWKKKMYSPKIKEELLPKLYRLEKIRKIPMTRVVNMIIEKYLEKDKTVQEKAVR